MAERLKVAAVQLSGMDRKFSTFFRMMLHQSGRMDRCEPCVSSQEYAPRYQCPLIAFAQVRDSFLELPA
jgi:hypothetical protein